MTSTITILLAEDEPFQKLAMTDLINMCGYDVIAVENGVEALNILRDKPDQIDLALIDVIMPEMVSYLYIYRMDWNA